MSNIDKHAVQTVADLKAGYTLGHADVAILNELARIALASLEAEKCAEPVAFINGAWTLVYYRPPKELGLKIGDKLYTAPPAPVSVPAAMEMDDDFDSAFEHGKAVGWNAYRAAMLQGADGNAPAHFRSRPAQSSLSPAQGGNSPVIPDGWVACSERMPEQFVEVLVCTEDGSRYVAALNQSMNWDDGDFFDDIQYVTHWMPLPAAPQQEVK
ncbi:DUF551 domain-containing protein [Enterobacter asburiae]|uniref:DUF551 domain-containing protein n=1 Tax=Enterobacter asburiae TaxID=61645 RepID=UPI0028EA3FED|nr:DUF551 domain-containing protein [Enterobacter asburiae]WNS31616.1 DUF551 domain-containing protein [Enterobacter asburiae]